MADHKPIQELIVPMDCFYGECEHADTDDHEVLMTVCDTCREFLELEELESFVPWPCAHESRRLLEQTITPAPTTETEEQK